MEQSAQVLVIGGGPGGATTAGLLAREGIDVTLLEKQQFPRYHIGESLLPSCLPILELLGVREKVDSYGFQRKRGGYFDWGGEKWDVTFGAPGDDSSYSYQVLRADFDQLLLEHAKEQGVRVIEAAEVKRLDFADGRPVSATWSHSGQEHEIGFRYLVDASGRAGVMNARYLHARRYHKAFQNIAIWGYWEGANALPAGPEGAVAICYVPDGWIWGIPLGGGRLSVGLVTHKDIFRSKRDGGATQEAIYQAALHDSPVIENLLAPAELVTSLRTEKDYSYASERFAGPGYFLVGDAACFLDPLLSTGVHLATYSAMLAAASLTSAIRGEFTEDEVQAHYEQSYRQAYLRLLMVVSNLYQQNIGVDSYFWEAQRLTLHDCSAGDLKQAFVDIVSGIEDLRDAQATLDLAMETTEKAMAQWEGWHWDPSSLNHSELAESEWQKSLDRVRELGSLPPQEQEQAQARAQFFSTALQRSPALSGQENRGLYVVTSPRLGLARL